MNLRTANISGSAIMIILITVALFGALSWAWMENSRGGVGWLMNEQSKAATTASAECQNQINAATKRLESRGCGSFLSTNESGALLGTAGEPIDGSCALYHPNGGGVKPCVVAVVPATPCGSSPTIGQVCSDGTIYAGLSPDGNAPMFITDASHEGYMAGGVLGFNSGRPYCIVSESSCNTGEQNTAALASNPLNLPAAYCANLTAHGHSDWYLPSRGENVLLSTLFQSGFGSLQYAWYYSSSERTDDHFWLVAMPDANFFEYGYKTNSDYVRCARK